MLLIISPAKKMDFLSKISVHKMTECQYKSETQSLLKIMQKKSIKDLMNMMSLSKALAELNYNRYQSFESCIERQALMAFSGDVYSNMSISQYTPGDMDFAQKHLRILSGLYGILKPLDLIRAYRLEMGVKLDSSDVNDLYSFWKNKLTSEVQNLINQDDGTLINLASTEYSSVLDMNILSGKIIKMVFKNFNNGSYKIVGLLAKRARGMMVDFIIRNKLGSLNSLKEFSSGGYKFIPSESSDNELCFFAQ
ncbi:MAG: YaaA family protein [Rickettsiales bacterium]|nr:YaaA family protein [Rickettsiales bacterium]